MAGEGGRSVRKFLAMGGQRAISLFDAMGAFVGWVCAMHATVGFVSCPGKGGIHRRLTSGRKRDPGATVPRGGAARDGRKGRSMQHMPLEALVIQFPGFPGDGAHGRTTKKPAGQFIMQAIHGWKPEYMPEQFPERVQKLSRYKLWCPGPESNRHALRRGILSPLRLPISPPGLP